MEWAVFVGIGLAVAIAVEGVYLTLARGQGRVRRVRARLDALKGSPSYTPEERRIVKERLLSDVPAIHRMLLRLPGTNSLALNLERAGLATRAAKVVAWSGGIFVVVFLAPPLFGAPIPASGILAMVAASAPFLYVLYKQHQRVETFSEQLPEGIDLLVRALKAGHSLPSGFRLIADELSNPIAREFAHVHEELNLGRPIDEALENMRERVDTMDVRLLFTSILIQRETGGNLVEILENLSDTIRRRMVFRSKLSALTAEGRLSGAVLMSLPPVMVLVISVLNPTYAALLFEPGMLRLALFGAAISQLAGILWIRQIVAVRY